MLCNWILEIVVVATTVGLVFVPWGPESLSIEIIEPWGLDLKMEKYVKDELAAKRVYRILFPRDMSDIHIISLQDYEPMPNSTVDGCLVGQVSQRSMVHLDNYGVWALEVVFPLVDGPHDT